MIEYTVTVRLNKMGQELLKAKNKYFVLEMDSPIENVDELQTKLDEKIPSSLYGSFWYRLSHKVQVGDLVVITVTDMDFTCPVVEACEYRGTFTVELPLDVQNTIAENFQKDTSNYYLKSNRMGFRQDEENEGRYIQVTKRINKATARLANKEETDNYNSLSEQRILIKEIGSITSEYFSDGYYETPGEHTTAELAEFLGHLKKFLRID